MTQSYANSPQQMAENDVQTNYPDVYRGDEDLRNHAYAVAQRQVEGTSSQTGGDVVQQFAEAYINAYNDAVNRRDAQV